MTIVRNGGKEKGLISLSKKIYDIKDFGHFCSIFVGKLISCFEKHFKFQPI